MRLTKAHNPRGKLIEGGSYSRAAFSNFGPIPRSAINSNSRTKDWFLRLYSSSRDMIER